MTHEGTWSRCIGFVWINIFLKGLSRSNKHNLLLGQGGELKHQEGGMDGSSTKVLWSACSAVERDVTQHTVFSAGLPLISRWRPRSECVRCGRPSAWRRCMKEAPTLRDASSWAGPPATVWPCLGTHTLHTQYSTSKDDKSGQFWQTSETTNEASKMPFSGLIVN